MSGPTWLAAGSLKIGELIKVNDPGDTLTIILTDSLNNTVQTIDFDTSCYEPLLELDEFGGVTIWSGETY